MRRSTHSPPRSTQVKHLTSPHLHLEHQLASPRTSSARTSTPLLLVDPPLTLPFAVLFDAVEKDMGKPEDGVTVRRSSGSIAMLTYVTGFDAFLMATAMIFACGAGTAQSCFLLFFQDLLSTAGASQATGGDVDMELVGRTCLWMVVLGGVMGSSCFIFYTTGSIAAARQKAAWKKAVMRGVLRQEVGWFDMSKPEELATMLTESVEVIFKGLGGEVYLIFLAIGLAVSGISIGFSKNWRVALVMLAGTPLCGLAFVFMVTVLSRSSKQRLQDYATAGGIATEALVSMRTIASFGLEEQVIRKYEVQLHKSKKADIRSSPIKGFATGLALSSVLLLQIIGFLYGGYTMSNEAIESGFDYVLHNVSLLDGARASPYTAEEFGSGGLSELRYCSSESNIPVTVTTSDVCPEGTRPWRMTCFVADELYQFNASGLAVFGWKGSILQALGMPTWDAFREYTRQEAPPEYIAQNPQYFGCMNNPAVILIAILCVMNGAIGFGQVGPMGQAFAKGRVAALKLIEIAQRATAIDPLDDDGDQLLQVRGDVSLKDVVFAYPAAPELTVCNGLSLDVAAGQTAALCGASGSGKSTVIHLLERFYDPMAGTVLLDGVDIKTLNVRWLRQQLGLVGQEPVLFVGSVAENIAYGREGVSEEEVVAAAKMANAHEFVTRDLSDGYNTQVGQRGGKLSGGQKQRVAIARAIIKRPSVLLLDEATSALDNESERVVQAALDELMALKQRTTIVIAHRLSTIQNADKIMVMERGKVVEEGSHHELITRGGAYHRLVQKQNQQEKQELAAKPTTSEQPHWMRTEAEPARVPTAETQQAALVPRRHKVAPAQTNLGEPLLAADEGGASANMSKSGLAMRVLRMQKESWGLMLLGVFFAFGSGGLPLVSFYYMTKVFTAMFQLNPHQTESDLLVDSGIVIALCGGIIACFVLDSSSFGISGARLTSKMRSQGIRSFMRQEMGFFDQESNSASELTTFLSEKVTLVEALTGGSLQALLRMATCIITLLLFTFIFGPWQLALSLFVLLPGIIIVSLLVIIVLGGGQDKLKEQAGQEVDGEKASVTMDAGRMVSEVVLSIRTVASFTAEQRFFAAYSNSSDRLVGLDVRAALVNGAAFGVANAALMFIFAFMYYYGMWLITVQQTDFTGMNVPLFMMIGGMMTIIAGLSSLKDPQIASAAAERFFNSVDRVSSIDPSLPGQIQLSEVRGEVSLKDVIFSYPSAPEHTVCNGLSLNVAAGQTAALCGASGSGKSTVIHLLERFYDPMAGTVLLDGVDIKTLNVRWLRQQLGLVGQEPVLFNGSVAENIAYGREGVSEEEVVAAAKMANAHEFVTRDLSDGYNTQVGAGGGKLSGGQKQRVAIARAIIKRPSVLLLDEATSALDNESERVVQAALDELMAMKQRTTIVIAHRLSTIQNADKIMVMERGKVVEEGTHSQLIELNGVYADLAALH